MDAGIQSRERVKDFGEVFTPDKIVNDMLDLVDKEIEPATYITTTYLEPACGDGQFLIRILYRKLVEVCKLPLEQRPIELIKALSSIYGVDIQADNVANAKKRMLNVATGKQVSTFDLNDKTNTIKINLEIDYTQQLIDVINYILDRNIICGNTLQDDILLTSYKFNANTVSIAECYLKDLSYEMNQSDYINYLDLPTLGQSTDEVDFDF